MRRNLTVLFIYLALFITSACEKEEIKPPLEGDWTLKESIMREYDKDGQLVSTSTVLVDVVPLYLTITPKRWKATLDIGPTTIIDAPYTRSGNTIRFTDKTWKLTELTDHTLRLHLDRIPSDPTMQSASYEKDEYYTR